VPDARPVLLVEPDAAGNTPLAGVLGDDGWDVVRATNAAVAFQQTKQLKPAALVVRGEIPGGAVGLVQKLRSCAHTALVPVVAVLADGSQDREPLTKWGVQALIDTPTNDSAIAAAVKTVAPEPVIVTQAPDAVLAEPARMKALAKTGLLDTPPEELFDRVSRLTAHLLDAPVILMSLVDRHRQFFKSQVGIPEPIATAQQTPLSHSFCQWVVAEQDDLVVPDTRVHPLLRLNGGTVDLGVVAYAGVPLRADSHETIGSFCAIDMKPREWDARELRALRDAAHVIEGLAALRQATHIKPCSFEEFRALATVTGHAVQAVARLQAAGAPKMTAEEQHDLLEVSGDLGRQLAEVAGLR